MCDIFYFENSAASRSFYFNEDLQRPTAGSAKPPLKVCGEHIVEETDLLEHSSRNSDQQNFTQDTSDSTGSNSSNCTPVLHCSMITGGYNVLLELLAL